MNLVIVLAAIILIVIVAVPQPYGGVGTFAIFLLVCVGAILEHGYIEFWLTDRWRGLKEK